MKKFFFVLLSVVCISTVFALPPIRQNPDYHDFANQVAHFGIPNFWNVVSNAAFLLVAAASLRSQRGQSICFRILRVGIAATAFGSAYYHWQPSDSSLVWDRLPMTIVFVCILTLTISDRIDPRLGRRLLWPLLVVGVSSVVYWRLTGDLRPYVVVQFYPLLAIPLMLLLLPDGVVAVAAQWWMICFYGIAKVAELADGYLGAEIPGGAHAWKHVWAALALLLYTRGLAEAQR